MLLGRLCEGVSTVSRPLDWLAMGGKADPLVSERDERVGDVDDMLDSLDVESADRRDLFGPKF